MCLDPKILWASSVLEGCDGVSLGSCWMVLGRGVVVVGGVLRFLHMGKTWGAYLSSAWTSSAYRIVGRGE